MVDFDDLKGKAEELLSEHADQVEGGIDKLADLAGKQFGHSGQIDQAAEKLKGFVGDQQDAGQKKPAPKRPAPNRQGGPGARAQGGPRAGKPAGSGPRPEGTAPPRGKGSRPGPPGRPRPQAD